MADLIDDLKVQIDASTMEADAKIDKFISKMLTLQRTITGLEMSGVGNIASGINQISNAVMGFSQKTKTADFTRIATGLNKLSGVDVQNIGDTARAISTFASNLTGLDKIHFDSKGMTDIAESVAKLGFAKVTEATQNLEFLKTSLSDFITSMNSVGSLTFNPDGLINLVKSVSRLGSINATQAVKNLPQISTFLRDFITSMNSVGSVTFDFAGLNSLVQNISRLGGIKATQAAINLKPLKDQLLRFVSGLNGIGALNFDVAGITNLVAAITRLGGKAAGNAIPNIQGLGNALRGMMQTLSGAPAVSQNLIQMTNALADLVSNGNRVGNASRSMYNGLNLYSSGAKKATSSSHSLASAIGRVYATYWMLFRGFRLFGKAINISSALTEVQNVIDVSFGNMSRIVENFTSNSIKQFGMSELTAKKMAGVFMAMGRSLGAPQQEMANMSVELTKLAADMASFYNVSQEDVGEDLRSVFTGMVRPLRDYGLDITQANLQQFAFQQGIAKSVQSMTQLEKVQLRYNYVMANTKSIQGDYARTSMNWANQVRLLSQQFQQLGSIVGGTLINAFKPFLGAMNNVISKVIAVAKAISDALGKIFGWRFESNGGGAGTAGLTGDLDSATESADNLAGGAGGASDALGDAADNAKKLAGNLQAFDKLNVISSQDAGSGGSGGSGGGGAGEAAGGSYGEWIQGDTIWEQYKSSIDNLYELGEYIGETLTGAMNNIDWDGVYQGARNFGKGLADFLNGLISPELFGATGRTIAGSLNTALHALDSFGLEFDWMDFGNSIASGVNNFFKTFDFDLLVNTFNTWAVGILESASKAIGRTDWNLIAEKIRDSLKKVDWENILRGIGELFWSSFNSVIDFTATLFNIPESKAAKAIGSIGGMVIALKGFAGLTKAIVNLKKITTPLGGILKVAGAAKYVTIAGGIAGLAAALVLYGDIKVDWGKLYSGLKNVISAVSHVAKGIGQGLIDFIEGITPVITPVLGAAINTVGGALDGIAKVLSAIPESVIAGLTTTFLSFFGAWKTYQGINTVITGVHNAISAATPIFQNFGLVIEGIGSTGSVLDGLAYAFGPSALGGIAFTAIAGGLLAIATQIMRVTNEAAENSSISQFANALDELSEEVSQKSEQINANLEGARNAVETAGLAEAQVARDLAAEYNELSGKASLSADEKERLKQVSQDLIDIVPSLNGYLNDETGYLDIQKESLDAVIQGYESLAQKQAAQEYLVEAYKNQYEAQMNVKTAQDEYNASLDEFILKNADLSDTVKELIKAGDVQAIKDLKDQVWGVNDSAKQLQYWFGKSAINGAAVDKMLTDLEKSTGGYKAALDDAVDTQYKAGVELEFMKDNANDANKSLVETNKVEMEGKLATSEYQQSLSDLTAEFSNMNLALSDDLMQKLALDEFDPTVLQDFFISLSEGVAASGETLQNAFEQLGLTLPNELAKALANKEPNVQAGIVRILMSIQSGVTANKEQLSLLFSNLGIELPDALTSNLATKEPSVQTETINLLSKIENGHKLVKDNLLKIFAGLGIEVPNSLINSLSDPEITAKTQEAAIELLGQISAAEESQRQPLIDAFNALGVGMADEGIIKALTDKTGETTAATNTYINDGIKKPLEAEKVNVKEESEGIGENIVDGVNAGIENNQGSTRGVIGSWVSNITGWFKSLLDINSPSGVFEDYAGFSVFGYNKGIIKNMQSSLEIMSNWADALTSSFGSVELTMPGMDTRYTVNTHVLDMIETRASVSVDGIRNISSSFDLSNSELTVAIKEQNELLRQQNELLEDIKAKELQIGDSDVYSAAKREQLKRYKATRKVGWAGID